MSSSDRLIYELSIEIAKPYVFIVEHHIMDALDQRVTCSPVCEGQFTVYHYTLPKGLYTLRIVVNGAIVDKVILLGKDLRFSLGGNNGQPIDLPELSTSVLFTGSEFGRYRSTHEYYREAVMKYSQVATTTSTNHDSDASIFIFLRYSSKESYKDHVSRNGSDCFDRFSILNDQMKLEVKLRGDKNAMINREEGWMAVHIALAPGLYFLFYEDKVDSRLIPLYNFKGNYVQCFMCIADKPLFGTLRIFNNTERQFRQDESVLMLVDLLLDKLHNQNFSLDEELVRYAMNQKVENTSFTLLTSYLYLSSVSEVNHELLDLISSRLAYLLKASDVYLNDIAAIGVMRMNIFGLGSGKQEMIMHDPPMIRKGFEAVVDASAEFPELIPIKSLNDYIAENLLYDSPYTTFRAPAKLLTFFRKDLDITPNAIAPDLSGLFKTKSEVSIFRDDTDLALNEDETALNSSEGKQTVVDFLGVKNYETMMVRFKKDGSSLVWPANDLFDTLQRKKGEFDKFTLSQAAKDLKIPIPTLKRLLLNEKLRNQTAVLIKRLNKIIPAAAVFLISMFSLFWFSMTMTEWSGSDIAKSNEASDTFTMDSSAVTINDPIEQSIDSKTVLITKATATLKVNERDWKSVFESHRVDTSGLMVLLSDSLKDVFWNAVEHKNYIKVSEIMDSVKIKPYSMQALKPDR